MLTYCATSKSIQSNMLIYKHIYIRADYLGTSLGLKSMDVKQWQTHSP